MSRLKNRTLFPHKIVRLMGGTALALTLLGGCADGQMPPWLQPKADADTVTSSAGGVKSTKLIERDVEAPDVFSADDQGLWDGRPSLGGVWIAHPDVTEPERVIIRNKDNGKFVIGALFRRERDLPGPKLQISSDAAAAIGVLAGAPAQLNVTALRREETEAPTQDATPTEIDRVEAAPEVAETSLDPIAAAGAAIDKAAPTKPTQASLPATQAKPAAPRASGSGLAKPFVQIGIFSIQANAERAAKQMRGAGMIPTIKKSQIRGKEYWRVVVGPATNRSELSGLLDKIKTEGFSDAYAVSS
ncbi:MAG: SPOR domain-containing protein [Pseudomonadota bacterium]